MITKQYKIIILPLCKKVEQNNNIISANKLLHFIIESIFTRTLHLNI
jgi:hypothetical protein